MDFNMSDCPYHTVFYCLSTLTWFVALSDFHSAFPWLFHQICYINLLIIASLFDLPQALIAQGHGLKSVQPICTLC